MRRWMLWLGVTAAVLLVVALGYGCGETSFGGCADNGTCLPDTGTFDSGAPDVSTAPDGPASGDDGGIANPDTGSSSGGGETGPAGCIPTTEPKDTPCLVDETYAIFVSAGALNGTGTKASPVGSIDTGLTLATREADGGAPKIVIVCSGKYDETITVDATRDRVRVFGGFQCANSTWTYSGAASSIPTLAPSAQGVPLTLTGLTGALFADIEIDAQSAPSTPPDAGSASGASSIAVVASNSMGIEFRRAKIVAGNGQPGADGVLVPYVFPSTTALLGNAADGGAGGPANAFACPDGQTTTGGKGGSAPDGNGDRGLPMLGAGAGGTSDQCFNQNQGGGTGASANAAGSGAGAISFGSLIDGAWTPGPGVSGSAGSPGQGGGGGGAGNAMVPGGGGGGGAGGCGGAGGAPGGGGGGSVAVLSTAVALKLNTVAIVSANAGNGGTGVPGQAGQNAFGSGGTPAQGGCLGGKGGTGGAGGAGGGGAGGVSAGILYKGSSPNLDTSSTAKFVQGNPGVKGKGGVAGTNDGVDGPTGVQVLVQ